MYILDIGRRENTREFVDYIREEEFFREGGDRMIFKYRANSTLTWLCVCENLRVFFFRA